MALLVWAPYAAEAHDGCDLCASGRPAKIYFHYTSSPCEHSNNGQGSFACSQTDDISNDPSDLDPTVSIRVLSSIGADQIFDDVPLGGTFAIDVTEDDTSIEITDEAGNVQYLTIHTGCAESIRVNEQYGSLKVADVPEQTSACTPTRTGAACASGLKPSSMTIRYTAESCAASAHDQADGKWSCSPDVVLSDSATIAVSGIATPFTVTTVPPGAPGDDTFVLTAADFGGKFSSNTFFTVTDALGQTQSIGIHTSCSTPLKEGDQFGSLIVEGLELTGSAKGGGKTPKAPKAPKKGKK
jgi:hypothetical protein